MLIGLSVHTFRLIHERELRVNRLSFVPLYCAIGVSVFMVIYYACHILFIGHIAQLADIEDEDQDLNISRYGAWRDVLQAPTSFFQSTLLTVSSCYSSLLRELL